MQVIIVRNIEPSVFTLHILILDVELWDNKQPDSHLAKKKKKAYMGIVMCM